MQFRYDAMDGRGVEHSGSVEANSQAHAIQLVKDKGYFPTSCRECVAADEPMRTQWARFGKKDDARTSGTGFRRHFGSRRALGDVAVLLEKIACMVEDGLPLLRVLHVIGQDEKNTRMGDVVNAMAKSIESGSTMAEAMMEHPKVFDTFAVNMVKAGEASGSLESCLKRLSGCIARNRKIDRKATIVVANLCIAWAILAVVVMAALSWNPVALHVIMLMVGIGLGGALLMRAAFPRQWDLLRLRVPFAGEMLADLEIATATGALGMMMCGGVPILQALNITRGTCRTSVFMDEIRAIHDDVKEGGSIAGGMGSRNVFPPDVVSRIMAGEDCGSLPARLVEIASEYDKALGI